MCRMSLNETPLPGIGVRRELDIAAGRRIGVVTHRDGQTDLILSDRDDPDACAASIPLTLDEAASLGALLAGPRLVAQLEDEHAELPGISTRQLILAHESPYAGEELGSTRMRTRTGVSIVAVVRAGVTHPSPGPDFLLEGGDLVIVVGTGEGVRQAEKLLAV